jgi:hypothetical protein
MALVMVATMNDPVIATAPDNVDYSSTAKGHPDDCAEKR